MNQLRKVAGGWAGAFAILSLVMGLTGCSTETFDEEAVKGIAPKGATNAPTAKTVDKDPTVFRVGDTIIITFSGMDPVIPLHQEIIKEDGTITPPEIGKSILAAGKTAIQLQQELLKEYLTRYVHPVVNVNPAPRYYYVFGDVNHQGPQQYLGDTDIVKAIAAAGGLTEFAKKTDIQLIRAGSSKVIHIDAKKAVRGDPKHDLPIYPGDKIIVPRSPW